MTTGYTKLIGEVYDLKRRLAALMRPVTVHEVKGDKMRMVIGKDEKGEDVIGPWIDTLNQRGGARERRFYKKGQNLMMMCPNGDPAQACIAPFAPNKAHKTPDHANETGQDEETYQLDDLRVRKTKTGYAIWLQDPKKDDQQQQTQTQTNKDGATPPKHEPQEKKAEGVALHINKDGGITARIGKDMRFAVHKDGVKMRAGDDFAVVQKGKLIVSRPWEIAGDPIPNRNDEDL